MTTTSRTFRCVLLACFFLCMPEAHGATILFEHTGATDPTTEGWTAPGGGIVVGPVLNDQGSGIDSWKVDDNGGLGAYRQIPTPTQIADASAQGWHWRARLRLVDIPDPLDFSVDVGYRNGSRAYTMGFGTTTAGDPIVGLFGSSFHTLTGLGSGYHQYDLIFDADVGEAELLVDGSLVESNYTGVAQAVTDMFWGSGQTSGSGHGNFALVQFAVGEIVDSPEPASVGVPEPGTLALVLLASGLVATRGRRRRWTTWLGEGVRSWLPQDRLAARLKK